MKILMLVPYPNIRGPIPKITTHLVEALRKRGCTVVTEFWGRHTDSESMAHKVVGRARDISRICGRSRQESFDLVLVHTSHDWSSLSRDLLLLLALDHSSSRIVLQLHGSSSNRLVARGNGLFKSASNWLFRLSDAILVLSMEELRQLKQFYPMGSFHRVINPFRSKDQPMPQVCNPSRNMIVDNPVLLFVGRLMEAKGIFDLLNAMPRVLERTPCHLVVVGEGKQMKEVRERVIALGIADRVTLTGFLTGEPLAIAYQTADVFVLPTIWKEGFPTVIAEAMNAGLPIVATRIRGTPDHLQEGINALFIPPHDPSVLAETIVRLLHDYTLRAKMSQANQEKVREFAPEVVADDYLRLFSDILQPTESPDDKNCEARSPKVMKRG